MFFCAQDNTVYDGEWADGRKEGRYVPLGYQLVSCVKNALLHNPYVPPVSCVVFLAVKRDACFLIHAKYTESGRVKVLHQANTIRFFSFKLTLFFVQHFSANVFTNCLG